MSTSGIISTSAGNGTSSYGGDSGPATAAQLNSPTSVTINTTGDVFVADAANNRLREVNTLGIITTAAGTGSGSYGGDGAAATAAQLNWLSGVFADGAGNLYIADYYNNRIRKVNTSGIITTIAGNGAGGYTGDHGPATAAEINSPTAVAVDASGNIYIADAANNVIRKVNNAGVITTIAGNGTGGFTGDAGPATAAEINSPYGVAADGAGNVYISDYKNNRVRMVNTSGTINTIAGNGTGAYSGDNGQATAAEINRPAGLAFDGSGNLYISDSYNHRIRKVAMFTCVATTGDTTALACVNFKWYGTTYTSSGTPTHILTNKAGCDSTVTLNLTINQPSTGDTNAAACGSFKWYGTTYTASGTLTHILTNKGGCDSTVTLNLTILPLPTITITGTSTIVAGSSDTLYAHGGVAYEWTTGSMSDTTIIKPSTSTTYIVAGKGTDGCIDTISFRVTVTPTGINNISYSSYTTLYPNPSINFITLSFEMRENNGAAMVKIIDGLGKEEIGFNTSIGNDKPCTIDVSSLVQGIYFAKIITANEIRVIKFIKQ